MNNGKLIFSSFSFCMLLVSIFMPNGMHKGRSSSLAASPISQTITSRLEEPDCYARFSTFAYGIPSNIQVGIRSGHTPSLPWVRYNYLPQGGNPNQITSNTFSLMTARIAQGVPEIWITRTSVQYPPRFPSNQPAPIADETRTFRTPSNLLGWEEVDLRPIIPPDAGALSNYTSFRAKGFTTLFGVEIWATYMFAGYTSKSQQNTITHPTVIVLAKFNDATKRFEVVSASMYTLTAKLSDAIWRFTADRNGMFWLYVSQDGLYRFDARANRLTKEMPAINIEGEDETDIYIAPSGNVYLNSLPSFSAAGTFVFKNVLRQLDLATKTVKTIPMPNPALGWPSFTKMLETRSGRLFGGAVMVRELDGKWNLVIPDLAAFRTLYKRYEDYGGRELPVPILESQDGRIWFNVGYSEGSPRLEGTAWYDPKAGEGCMFTTTSAPVIEDPAGYVWTIVDNGLYRREPKRVIP